MFRSITLEMSLKPFKRTDDAYIKQVCEHIFEQWAPLLKNRDAISVMLWTSDGSEILDYTGDMEQEFEWCYFLGTANLPLVGELPAGTNLHKRKQLYMDNPPKMTYKILKKIIAEIKNACKRKFPNVQISVGETFDIGPEFAISDFKYNRHKECCKGVGCSNFGFVDATVLLEPDNYPYAAYPNGLPAQTPMGTLLGAQANIFLKDMGFDYIWLSNGMGFCYEPWNEFGKIFDGKKFYPEKLSDTKKKIFLFWKLFRDACPDFPIMTRGTNYSVGMDYASDGVPLYDIYQGEFNITPPPNSPWAAINDDIGIEVLGQLTRNCNLPGKDYMFRYYIHDIWWMNSPWYDRYEGNPYDIYIPLALSRIDEDGNIQNPSLLNILSIDNSMGDMPDSCVYEPLPHILKAEKDAPDEPGPFVLVYPMKEYTTTLDADMLYEMYYGDYYLKNAINQGFPLSTVVSTNCFEKHLENMDLYRKSVLVVPATCGNTNVLNQLCNYANSGGKIIVYGSKKVLSLIDFPCAKVDIDGPITQIFSAMETFKYKIYFKTESATSQLPSMTWHRSDNAMFINVYNRDTTMETQLSFPLGAPIINGYDTLLKDGYAIYHFPRSLHAECRVFVKQNGGIVRAREAAPVNRKYRRKIKISGLENAEVCLFAESYCLEEAKAMILEYNDADMTEPLKEARMVSDPENGTYLYIPNISGEIYFAMPFPDRMDD